VSDIGYCEGDEDRPGHTELGTNRVGDIILCDACLEEGGTEAAEHLSAVATAIVRNAGDPIKQVEAVLPILQVSGRISAGAARALRRGLRPKQV
jgi:hypothetical protein